MYSLKVLFVSDDTFLYTIHFKNKFNKTMKTYRQLLEEQNNLGKNFEKYRKNDEEKDENKNENEEEENRKKIVLP